MYKIYGKRIHANAIPMLSIIFSAITIGTVSGTIRPHSNSEGTKFKNNVWARYTQWGTELGSNRTY